MKYMSQRKRYMEPITLLNIFYNFKEPISLLLTLSSVKSFMFSTFILV